MQALARLWGSYNHALQTAPIVTKSLTSGAMYGLGDVICQVGTRPEGDFKDFKVDWKRVGVMILFGTVVSGPMYHYWFAYLDELPLRLLALRKHRQRWEILRAYGVFKKYNIPVGELVLPETKQFHKYSIKASKILMDQLVFSSIYTGTFFFGIGILNGVFGVGQHGHNINAKHDTDGKHTEINISPSYQKLHPEVTLLIESLQAMRTEQNAASIDRIIHKLEASASHKTFPDIVREAWEHTKKVYVTTYIADCVVWPPLQLINFTFIPLRFQVLYVNMCNLFWNTFLSFMANGPH
eukprot:TRINITY_DN1553_c0_g1_i1.p1 TRINITY_DN1553_c0_g1~~TRINITY_DN1553_c0_g1_i1.p1  ORF type:complete len:296 (-),score=55.94 TRINITY_DN1553_c0_g1_i1:15-902(-)